MIFAASDQNGTWKEKGRALQPALVPEHRSGRITRQAVPGPLPVAVCLLCPDHEGYDLGSTTQVELVDRSAAAVRLFDELAPAPRVVVVEIRHETVARALADRGCAVEVRVDDVQLFVIVL